MISWLLLKVLYEYSDNILSVSECVRVCEWVSECSSRGVVCIGCRGRWSWVRVWVSKGMWCKDL